MHIISLSGENLALARLEAETLLKLEHTRLQGNMLYCTIPSERMKLANRLSFTKRIHEVVFTTSRKNLEAALKGYPWINMYEKNFCLRITSDEHYDERYYSGFIWQSLERSTRPKVSLDNADLFIEIFISKDKKDQATVTRLIYQNFETFEERKAHLKPYLHPTAMHPKMARALVNIVDSDKIIDPFCGACGILTEAGLLGIHFTGYDIDKNILDNARKNLEYYDIDDKHYELIVKDATKAKGLKNVVTDLPYGKSSKKSEGLIDLYAKFLRNIAGRAVIVMPDFMPYKSLLAKNLPKKLIVTHIIDHYVHKSLTRKIIVIDLKTKKGSKQTKKALIKNIKHSPAKKRIKKTIKKQKGHKRPIKKISAGRIHKKKSRK